tara:strand:- start:248 stop:412 length:165 start_codon:yes stop_codon:yes gene_type:complete
MAKTAIKAAGAQQGGKDMVKVIKCVKSDKTGAYTFKEAIVHKDNAKEYFQKAEK